VTDQASERGPQDGVRHRDEQVPGAAGVPDHAPGDVEAGREGAGDGAHHPRSAHRRCHGSVADADPSDGIVGVVHGVEIPTPAVHGQLADDPEGGAAGRAVLVPGGPCARQGKHALRGDLADETVSGIGHVNDACVVHRDPAQAVEQGVEGRGGIGKARGAFDAPRDGGDHPVGDLPDAVVIGIRDIHGAKRVHPHAQRVVELRADGKPAGWLLIYHGVSGTFSYRLGFALLDKDNPAKVLGRTTDWVLEPEMKYEQEGQVNNVVFPCGAVIRGDTLYVYYGGADTVIGLATGSIKKILKTLRH